jgi:hypothetical protein
MDMTLLQQIYKMLMYKLHTSLEKYYAIAGDEFGKDRGKTALLCVLYMDWSRRR